MVLLRAPDAKLHAGRMAAVVRTRGGCVGRPEIAEPSDTRPPGSFLRYICTLFVHIASNEYFWYFWAFL